MKASSRLKEPRGGKILLCRAAEPSRAESALFATLGLAGLIAIGISVIWGSVPAELKGTPADGRSAPMATYVRSGQLTADMRTAAAALHYLLESEAALATNSSDIELTQKKIATPTNATTAKPKA